MEPLVVVVTPGPVPGVVHGAQHGTFVTKVIMLEVKVIEVKRVVGGV